MASIEPAQFKLLFGLCWDWPTKSAPLWKAYKNKKHEIVCFLPKLFLGGKKVEESPHPPSGRKSSISHYIFERLPLLLIFTWHWSFIFYPQHLTEWFLSEHNDYLNCCTSITACKHRTSWSISPSSSPPPSVPPPPPLAKYDSCNKILRIRVLVDLFSKWDRPRKGYQYR